MKSIKYLVVLACMTFASVSLFAQTKILHTEEDGFQWYELEQNGKIGAQSISGVTFIPLSRGYTYICYHSTSGGWFSVNNSNDGDHFYGRGVCDITGREIVAPGRYDYISYTKLGGYERCKVELNGKEGLCDRYGQEIISPRYDKLITAVADEDGGYYYYHIELNGKTGALDMNCREIVAPIYEGLVVYKNDHIFRYKDASGKWVSTGIKLEKSSGTDYASGNSSNSNSSSSSSNSSKIISTTTASSSSTSSTSSGSKKVEGLLYQGDYTEGTLVGQRTGWTMAPGFPQHFGIRIYEDHLEDMGTWKYEGKSMNGCRVYSMTQGWGSSAQTVKYYVDGNFNITAERVVCSGIGPCETYISQFSKGNVAFDINSSSQGSYNGGNADNGGNNNNVGGTTTQQKQHKCGLCGGTGRVVENNATSFGNTKYCNECGKTVPDSHYHTTCPSCKGKGWW